MRGVVYATTVVRPRGEEPYNVCLVDLEDGERVMGRVEGLAPDAVTIGLRVESRAGEDGVVVYDPL
jgi:uncharacterized protein